VIDTAINYRFQRSERWHQLGVDAACAKGFARDEFILCTKGGYLTPDGSMPSDPNEYFYSNIFSQGFSSRMKSCRAATA